MQDEPSTRPGYCKCGCGQKAPLARSSNTKTGRVKGQPLDWVHGHNRPGPPVPFWREEDRGHETPCWIWQRYIDPQGYARYQVNGENSAHRVIYKRERGPIPEGTELDHLCRQRACVNPDHLEPVPQIENIRRGLVAKFGPEEVRAIRASDKPHAEVAEQFNTTVQNIYLIRKRRNWKDIE